MTVLASEFARRATDSGWHRLTRVIKDGVLITCAAGLVAAIAFYLRVKDVVAEAPEQKEKVQALETWKAVSDERWERVEKFMDRIDKKLDNL